MLNVIIEWAIQQNMFNKLLCPYDMDKAIEEVGNDGVYLPEGLKAEH